MGDLAPFVADYWCGRIGAICGWLFQRAYVWEIWRYLPLTFPESLGVKYLAHFVADLSESLGFGDLKLFVADFLK